MNKRHVPALRLDRLPCSPGAIESNRLRVTHGHTMTTEAQQYPHLIGLIRLLSSLLAMNASPGFAQDSTPRQAAEQVVRRAFEAIEAMRWRDVAPLLHPDALGRFRATQLDPARSSMRIQTSAHRDPEMPEAVA